MYFTNTLKRIPLIDSFDPFKVYHRGIQTEPQTVSGNNKLMVSNYERFSVDDEWDKRVEMETMENSQSSSQFDQW